MEKGGEEVKIMPEGIEQYIKKLASDAYLNLERSDMHGARVRVLQILAVIKENKIKKQFEEIYDSAEQIIRLFEEANFRMAEELLLSIFGKKELSSKEFEKRKRELRNINYSTWRRYNSKYCDDFFKHIIHFFIRLYNKMSI